MQRSQVMAVDLPKTMTMWTVLLCCLSLVGGYYLRAKVYPRATPKEL